MTDEDVWAEAEIRLAARLERNRQILDGLVEWEGTFEYPPESDAMYAAEFSEDVPASEADPIHRIRVRGYALHVMGLVPSAKEELEKAVTNLERARRRAEKALAYRDAVIEHSEDLARCVVADDPDWNEEVASCLEELIG
jgi:hypothetical protein